MMMNLNKMFRIKREGRILEFESLDDGVLVRFCVNNKLINKQSIEKPSEARTLVIEMRVPL